jgi:hypothetical protein
MCAPGHLRRFDACAVAGPFGTRATEIDPRNARYMNDDLADYSFPVNADTPSVKVILVAEENQREPRWCQRPRRARECWNSGGHL